MASLGFSAHVGAGMGAGRLADGWR